VVEFLAFLANEDLSNYSKYDLEITLVDFRSKNKRYTEVNLHGA
jgi:hypothetical protein